MNFSFLHVLGCFVCIIPSCDCFFGFCLLFYLDCLTHDSFLCVSSCNVDLAQWSDGWNVGPAMVGMSDLRSTLIPSCYT